MSAEKGSSKADTLVKVVLVFFISLLSFSVGTFVGKQVSDSDHRRMALEGEYGADRKVASTDAHHEGDHSDKISDKEVESLTEEFVNKEKATREPAEAGHDHAEEHAAPAPETHAEAETYKAYPRGQKPAAEAAGDQHHAPPAAAAEPAHHDEPKKKTPPAKSADAAHGAAEKVAHDKAPTDGMKEERKPSSALPSVASSAVGKYTVQVASYADEKEAKSHAATLKGKGWNAFYLAADVSGRTWYRVLVGLFNNDKSAREFRAQFMKETNTKAAIVQKIVQ